MDIASLLKGFSALLWLGIAAMVVLAVLRASRGLKARGLSIAILVTLVVAIVLTVVSAGLVFIRPEDRGVVLSALSDKGYREQPLQPGLRWVVPYFEQVVIYPISRQSYTMSIAPLEGEIKGDDSITARTFDGQEIFLDASVLYAIDPAKVVEVHIDWQDRYEAELIRPLVRGIMRDAVSQYKVEEVVSTKRLELSQTIRDEMQRKMDENGLTLVDFIMRNITFSPGTLPRSSRNRSPSSRPNRPPWWSSSAARRPSRPARWPMAWQTLRSSAPRAAPNRASSRLRPNPKPCG
jgi:regulator of protease activity HflC (stomatin/prohibitin superfamily)